MIMRDEYHRVTDVENPWNDACVHVLAEGDRGPRRLVPLGLPRSSGRHLDEVSVEGLMPLITTDQKMYATWPESWSDDALVRLFDHIGSWRDFDASAHRFTTRSFIRLRLKGWTSTDSRCP